MDFIERRKEQLNIKSAEDMLNGDIAPINIKELLVNGPKEIDANIRRWQKGDNIGIIAGSGTGKTSFILWNFKNILLNNPDGICVFVALEMSEGQLLSKWQKATAECPEINSRLYIITAYDDQGAPLDMSIRGIKKRLNLYKSTLGVELLAYAVDHLHIIQRDINESLDTVVFNFTRMTKELNSLAFLTSQTTKGKSGCGDIPLDKTACYGTSAFEWEMTQIYTLCQPLKRISDKINLPVTSWQLAKNRFKERLDEFKESSNYLLKFTYDDECYVKLTPNELRQFSDYYEEVVEIRKAEEKSGAYLFDTSYTVKSKDGRAVKVNNMIGGNDWD